MKINEERQTISCFSFFTSNEEKFKYHILIYINNIKDNRRLRTSKILSAILPKNNYKTSIYKHSAVTSSKMLPHEKKMLQPN